MNDQKWGFPGSSAGKESTCNSGDPQFDSRVEKICWRRDRLPTPVFLGFPDGSDSKSEVSACNAEDLGSIPGFGRSLGLDDPLEEGMATHSSILAWRIPWTEAPTVWATVCGVAKSWT